MRTFPYEISCTSSGSEYQGTWRMSSHQEYQTYAKSLNQTLQTERQQHLADVNAHERQEQLDITGLQIRNQMIEEKYQAAEERADAAEKALKMKSKELEEAEGELKGLRKTFDAWGKSREVEPPVEALVDEEDNHACTKAMLEHADEIIDVQKIAVDIVRAIRYRFYYQQPDGPGYDGLVSREGNSGAHDPDPAADLALCMLRVSLETLKYLVKNRNSTGMINLKAALKLHVAIPGPTLDLFWKLAGECELIRSTYEELNAPGKARQGFETNWDVERKLSRMRQLVNGMPWLQHPQPKE
ncbi:uncharacterized protein PAC_19516 [Phialocephala subalpina]|uniref:Uncharacterized protein n=1 Tax=Phialocephala subalpina TaxID=576137 RepID=A0A1L7XX59_9HELO|nr:uncharacterized protein PAC_19516 [Phialocephala subalpina]